MNVSRASCAKPDMTQGIIEAQMGDGAVFKDSRLNDIVLLKDESHTMDILRQSRNCAS
jgi:hypothetical protein